MTNPNPQSMRDRRDERTSAHSGVLSTPTDTEPPSTTGEDVATTAGRLLALGFSTVPPMEDGSKRPFGKWSDFQGRLPSTSELESWYRANTRAGVGVVTGKISRNLELFEFDVPELYDRFRERASDFGIIDLLECLESGYCEATPSGGLHFFYTLDTVPETLKLAHSAKTADKPGKTMIETKGEGGYAILAPSYGRVHPSGEPYRVVSGSLETIPHLSSNERDALHSLARSFDERIRREVSMPLVAKRFGRPGDAFDAAVTWADILSPHGWTLTYEVDSVGYWEKPGQKLGRCSATLNYNASDRLYVFTTATEFDPNTSYTKFGAYALLNHAGDFSAAAAALRDLGYGTSVAGVPTKLYTQLTNAERLIELHGQDIFFLAGRGWCVWRERGWDFELAAGEVYRMAMETVRGLYKDVVSLQDTRDRERLLRHIMTSESHAGMSATLAASTNLKGVTKSVAEIDAHPWLFECANGTIDLQTGKLLERDRSRFITKRSPVAFDPDAQSDAWDDFVHHLTGGDREFARYLQRVFGYALTGDTTEEACFFLYGPAATGKSTLVDALASVYGDHYRASDFSTFASKQTGGIPNDLARLAGVRVVITSELDEGQRLATARVKALVAGDVMTARFLHQEFMDFRSVSKLFIVGNHVPQFDITDDAMVRRIVGIPLSNAVAEVDRDPEIKRFLSSDPDCQAAILRWMVDGCLEMQRLGGLAPPAVILAAQEEMLAAQNPLSAFVNEECRVGDGGVIPVATIRDAYHQWARREGIEPVAPGKIAGYLEALGVRRKRGTGGIRMYSGIRLAA